MFDKTRRGFFLARFYLNLILIFISMGVMVYAQEADMALVNGKIITMNDAHPRAEALAIKDGRILKVGAETDIRATIGKDTRVLDLHGATAIPGFIEGHGHLKGIGNARMILGLMRVRNWDEVVAMVASDVSGKEAGAWILGRGWHQEKWDKTPADHVNGYPNHRTLSAVSPNHPVVLRHASGHALFANGKAMTLAGVTAKTPDPPGGAIIRDAAGNPIGVFEETAMGLIDRAYQVYLDGQTPEKLRERDRLAIQTAIQECLAKGITSFHDAGAGFDQIDLYRDMAKKGELGIRLWVMAAGSNEELAKELPRYSIKDEANFFLTVGGIKKYMDGALGSRGAWLLAPYEDLPASTGQNVVPLSELKRTAEIALANGVQLCTHAIGDRGNREVLDVYKDAMKGKNLRWRIEHAQHLHPDDIPRFAELHVIASMQGVHCTSDAPFVIKRLGEQRARTGAYVWKALLESGAIVTNGTDAPVEDVSPLASYYAMATRITNDGAAFFPEQKLSREQALKSYTLNNAYAAFEEKIKGSLESGKLADITVLSQDITTIPAEEISEAKVKYTIVGGKIAYRER